ncbi:MAG: hypothetical protein ABSF69_04050 [Polyangiaceae bacterium]|jgi:hypothetical protein
MFEGRAPGGTREAVSNRNRTRTSPKRVSPLLDAIRQALDALTKLPESPRAQQLRDQCLAYEHIAEQWTREPPTPEDREALMKRVLSLNAMVDRVHRSGLSPKLRGGDAIGGRPEECAEGGSRPNSPTEWGCGGRLTSF